MILRKKIILVSKMILKIWGFSKDLERSENKNHHYNFGGFSFVYEKDILSKKVQ